MLYRWREPNNILMMTDLANAYLGETLFIIGGNPTIKDMPLELLEQPGILTMALNNVPYVFPSPTFWLTADKPTCYSGHVYKRADIIKLAKIDTSLEVPHNTHRELRTFPGTYFYELHAEKYGPETFFSEGVDFAWWRSVFPIALQMAWRFGFRRINLVGCSFWTSVNQPYAWGTKLTEAQRTYNQLTYNADVSHLAALQPHFKGAGLKVISCTTDSRANGIIPYETLEEAVERATRGQAEPTPLSDIRHSSAAV